MVHRLFPKVAPEEVDLNALLEDAKPFDIRPFIQLSDSQNEQLLLESDGESGDSQQSEVEWVFRGPRTAQWKPLICSEDADNVCSRGSMNDAASQCSSGVSDCQVHRSVHSDAFRCPFALAPRFSWVTLLRVHLNISNIRESGMRNTDMTTSVNRFLFWSRLLIQIG